MNAAIKAAVYNSSLQFMLILYSKSANLLYNKIFIATGISNSLNIFTTSLRMVSKSIPFSLFKLFRILIPSYNPQVNKTLLITWKSYLEIDDTIL